LKEIPKLYNMKKDYNLNRRNIGHETNGEKSGLPFAIFLVILFIIAYLVFQNLYFT